VSSRDDGARDERAQAEEQAWREIVDHYGDEPDVEPDPSDEPDEPGQVEGEGGASPEVVPEVAPEPFRFEPYDEHFVPPPLPPPPEIATDRRFAWVGLVAPPLLLLIAVVLDYPLPDLLTGALVVAFLGSFGYLVATMSREPRDPDDDGARL